MKKCRSCGAEWENPSDGFYKASWGGFRSPCKACTLKRSNEYHKKNREAQRERCRNHYANNKEKYRQKTAEWAAKNPERLKELRKRQTSKPEFKEKRRKMAEEKRKDAKFRLVNSTRTGIGRAVKGCEGKIRHLPYTAKELCNHLEKQFSKGMSWENYGEWHVDHIIPLSSFKFAPDPACPEFQACWALTNLRPMWAKENMSKKDKRTHLI